MTSSPSRNNRTAGIMALVGLVMLGLAFASVPLYRVFCQVTGYGGTTQRAEVAPGADVAEGKIGVRFDANTDAALPWKFEPEQERVRVVPGAQTKIYYRATNLVARPTTGQAVFNVTPVAVGQYFSKIECFCFTEQTLKPGETVEMPIVFFVDPDIAENKDLDTVRDITLSYTFYAVKSEGS